VAEAVQEQGKHGGFYGSLLEFFAVFADIPGNSLEIQRFARCGVKATERPKPAWGPTGLFDTGDSPCRFALKLTASLRRLERQLETQN
jgi:hypothetical protein